MTNEVDTVAVEAKKAIINQKLIMYRNTLYDISLDVKISRVLEDEAQEEAAQNRMKPLLTAIEFLETELHEVENKPEVV